MTSNVHHSVHKIPSLDTNLKTVNAVHTATTYFCKIRFNIIPLSTPCYLLHGEGLLLCRTTHI